MREFTKLRTADRYMLMENGRIRAFFNHLEDPSKPVVVREFLPADGGELFETYQAWVSLGNQAEPEFTQEETEQRASQAEAEALKTGLRQTDHWLFRMILEVWAVGVDKGLWSITDISNEDLKAKVQIWKTKLDRLEQLGE